MHINLIAMGTKMPTWIDAGFQEYAKRLTQDCALQLIELPLAKRAKKQPVSHQNLQKEGKLMLQTIPAHQHVIALDVKGKMMSTETLAQHMQQWLLSGRDVSLLIGGPDGLAPACLETAQMRWSLSPLTLPHGLVRILVAEQLYRAWSILHHHPYHRG